MRSYNQYCALAKALDRVGNRWTLLIIRELLVGPKRYSDLRAGLPGIASNLLSERLRELQSEGIVRRRELPPPAASVVYELTDLGARLESAVVELVRWGAHWMTERREGEVFRPNLLVVALRALLPSEVPPSVRLSCEIRTAGACLQVLLDGGSLRVELGPPPEADVIVKGDPRSLLEFISGDLPSDEALRTGRVTIEGPPAARASLKQLFAGVG